MTAAATQLASKALTEDSCITHCSAALRAMEGTVDEVLQTLRAGISTAVRGVIPSEALLLVLLMRLDQLADDKDLPGCSWSPWSPQLAAAGSNSAIAVASAAEGSGVEAAEAAAAAVSSILNGTGVGRTSLAVAAEDSSFRSPKRSRMNATDDSTPAPRCSALLSEDVLSALVKLVDWSSLHHAEVKALTNQAISYSKATPAAMCCGVKLMQEASYRLGKPFNGLPDSNTPPRYLACWCNITKQEPDRAVVTCPLLGYNRLRSGSTDVSLFVQDNRKPAGMPESKGHRTMHCTGSRGHRTMHCTGSRGHKKMHCTLPAMYFPIQTSQAQWQAWS